MANDTKGIVKGIFVSYRRDETAGYAGRLADRLSEHFGEDMIFRDVDDIAPGLDFIEAIQRALSSSEVLLAVIGRTWSTVTDTAGQKRLQDPEDYVRMEIATALKRNVQVMPVLVQGASMPSARGLPNDLAPLTRRNAFELHENSWRYDIQRLIITLEKAVAPSGPIIMTLMSPRGKVSNFAPTVQATVKAERGYVPKRAIRLYIDDTEETRFSYDPATGELSYRPTDTLSAGTHTVHIEVNYKLGDEMLTTIRSWGFTVESSQIAQAGWEAYRRRQRPWWRRMFGG